ncbi:MAG: hypothetical protein ACYC1B_02065, partial [Thermoleophilia bacterium]
MFFRRPTTTGEVAAIHVPEGLIPATQAVAWYVPALAFVGAGLRSIKQRFAID